MSLNELVADIHAFRDYMRAERGLAENTLLAYTRDLERYAEWVGLVQLPNIYAPTLRDMSRYIAYLNEQNLAAPSLARHIASLRMFYRFLRLEERADPTATDLLASPKLWERIPGVLSPDKVDALLSNEFKWTTKKDRLNKSGACRVLDCKPKELEQMIEKWKEILGPDLFD